MATARHNGGERGEGIDIGTLAVAAIAAAVAAVVTSKLWPDGTVISTAMTPVIVALVKEWLRRPAERISAVTAKAPEVAARVVSSSRGAPFRDRPAPAASHAARHAEAAPPSIPTPEGQEAVLPPAGSPAAGTPPDEMFVEPAPPDAPSRYRLYRRRGVHWRLAVLTGLVACMIAVLAITLPELVLGGSVGGRGGTTVFGGGSGHSSQTKGDGTKKSDARRSRERSSTSEREQKQSPARSSSQSPSQPNGSSSAKQAPSSSSSGTQSTPSAPTGSGAPGAPGSPGSGGSPSGGQ